MTSYTRFFMHDPSFFLLSHLSHLNATLLVTILRKKVANLKQHRPCTYISDNDGIVILVKHSHSDNIHAANFQHPNTSVYVDFCAKENSEQMKCCKCKVMQSKELIMH